MDKRNVRIDVIAIEDEEAIRWIINHTLSLLNISFLIAESGLKGLELILNHKPRLALIDIGLGSIDGLEIARQVCRECTQTKIILCTGYGDTIQGYIEDLHIVEVIEKPFEISTLTESVRKALI